MNLNNTLDMFIEVLGHFDATSLITLFISNVSVDKRSSYRSKISLRQDVPNTLINIDYNISTKNLLFEFRVILKV